jgi:hypothetical protein
VLLILEVIVVDRSEARSAVRCRTTLLFLSTLKSASNDRHLRLKRTKSNDRSFEFIKTKTNDCLALNLFLKYTVFLVSFRYVAFI